MVEIETEYGIEPYVCCEKCTNTMGAKDRVWYLSVIDWINTEKENQKKIAESKKKTYIEYESPGFCSLECLLQWVGENIRDGIVSEMYNQMWKGGEE